MSTKLEFFAECRVQGVEGERAVKGPKSNVQRKSSAKGGVRGVEKTKRNSEFRSQQRIFICDGNFKPQTSNKDLTIHRSLFTVH
jgi:hypothetical protein